MMSTRTLLTLCTLAAGVIGTMATPVTHASDSKGISTANCQPYGPNTVAGNLAFTNNGIRNIAGTTKQIICPVNKDYFGTWDDTHPASLTAYFKTGNQPGQMWCTSFVGGPASNGSGTYSNTGVSGPKQTAVNGQFGITLRDPTVDTLAIENANVICTLTPQVLFGGFFYVEPDDTDGSGS